MFDECNNIYCVSMYFNDDGTCDFSNSRSIVYINWNPINSH